MAVVQRAIAQRRTLAIWGSKSKDFYIENSADDELETLSHKGIIDYFPDELVISVRSGTRLTELREILDSEKQVLAGDPPCFQGDGTVGGAVACGFSGPGRPWLGSLRDCILGIEMINGLGKKLRFGGTVMKNVAGYDISRLLAGSLGTLGVLLSVNLKALPRARFSSSWRCACPLEVSIRAVQDLEQAGISVTATCHTLNDELYVRIDGSLDGLNAASRVQWQEIDDTGFWESVRDHTHPFFQHVRSLYRISLPKGGDSEVFQSLPSGLVEWNGGRIWCPELDHGFLSKSVGAHATDFWPEVFKPRLNGKLMTQIKTAFDPSWIFNPSVVEGEPPC